MIGLNNLAADIPRVGSSCPLFPGWIGIQNVGFCGGRKPEDPEKNPAEQGREPTKKILLPLRCTHKTTDYYHFSDQGEN